LWDRCPQREETRTVASLSMNILQRLPSGIRARASRWGHLSHRDCVARLAAFVGPLSSAGRNSRGAKPEHEYSAAAAFKHQSKSFQVGTPVPQELRSEVMPLLWDRCPQREETRAVLSLSIATGAAAVFKQQSQSFQVGTPVPQELRSEVMPLLWDRCPQREETRAVLSLSIATGAAAVFKQQSQSFQVGTPVPQGLRSEVMLLLWDRCPQREETRAVLSLSINTVQQLYSGIRARASRWGHLSHRDCVARLAAFVGPLSSAGRSSHGGKPEHEYSAAAAFKHQSQSFQVGTPVPQGLRSEVSRFCGTAVLSGKKLARC